ncbi:MAG TPA: hypothetical protein VII25_00665 [Candidatus Acidoferrum sp.]
MMRPFARRCALFCALAPIALLAQARPAVAQISPSEIRDPDLKALEKQYLPQLKSLNQSIAHMHFPFTFYLSRYVGLDPAKQAEADSRGLEFVNFRERTVLKITGNYNAAYDSQKFTRNERAARTFEDVLLPILQTVTQVISPDIACDAIGFEVSYHTRANEKSYDYEGKETLVVVVDRQNAFRLAQATNDQARQDILSDSQIFLGGKEYGLSLLEKDPLIVDTLPRTKPAKPEGSSTTSSSTTVSRLTHSNPNPLLGSSGGSMDPAGGGTMVAKTDLSLAKPAATAAEAEKLQSQYKAQLESLSQLGQSKFQFVDYDPPAFVVINKEMVLQMTLRNALHFDAEKASIYKRAAQTFDLFLAPKMKDILAAAPEDAKFDFYDFSVVNLFATAPGSKERSEAIEFVFPKGLTREFADSEITNQELIDRGQVLVNGVRIALNLQLVE